MSDLIRSIRSKAAILPLLFVAGCTTLSPEGPFAQVGDTVQLRLAKQISWDAGQYEDPRRSHDDRQTPVSTFNGGPGGADHAAQQPRAASSLR